jgi:hypothetical protein
METTQDYKDAEKGEVERRNLPALFPSKRPFPFNLKRPAYDRGSLKTQDGQSPQSRDK